MSNIEKNQNIKYSLWAKRLVFGSLEGAAAATAIEAVITEEKKKKIPEQDVAKLAEAAKAKLRNDEKAKEQVDAAKGRFETFVSAVKQRTLTQATLETINIDPAGVDIAGWISKLAPLKGGRAALVAQFGEKDDVVVALDTKDAEIINMEEQLAAKKRYYEDLLESAKPAALPVERLRREVNTAEHVTAVLAYIAKLEVVRAQGYEYLDEADKGGVNAQFVEAIGKARQELTGSESTLATVLTEDQKTSLANMEFAESNLNAALKGGEAQHKAGAMECWTASMAEQEARNVWNQLSFTAENAGASWRPAKFGQPVVGWNEQGPWKKLYDEGQAAFAKGMENFKTSKGSGKWSEATDAFRTATAKWQELLNEQNRRGLEDGNKEDAKKKAEADEATKIVAYNKLIDKLPAALATVRNLQLYEKFIKPQVEALKGLAGPGHSVESKAVAVNDLLNTIGSEVKVFETEVAKVKTSISRAVQQNVKEEYYKDSTKVQVIKDYLMDPRLRNSVAEKYRSLIFTSNLQASGTMTIDGDTFRYSVNFGRGEPVITEMPKTDYQRSPTLKVDFGMDNVDTSSVVQELLKLKENTGSTSPATPTTPPAPSVPPVAAGPAGPTS